MDREDFIQSSVRIRYAEKNSLLNNNSALADAKTWRMLLSHLMKLYSSEISKLDRPGTEEVLSDVLK